MKFTIESSCSNIIIKIEKTLLNFIHNLEEILITKFLIHFKINGNGVCLTVKFKLDDYLYNF